jgi:hypothetical protein
LHNKYLIHTYALDVYSENATDGKERMREIVQKLEKELRVSFLYYIYSGSNIFSPSCIDDELQFPCMLTTNKYFLIIRKVSSFNLDHLEMCQMDKNPV